MILLVGAVREEVLPVKKALRLNRRDPHLPFPSYRAANRDDPVLLIQTGIGRDRVQNAVACAMAQERIDRIVSFGFCGALVDGVGIGEIALYTSVRCEEETSGRPTIKDHALDEQLIAWAEQTITGCAGNVRRLRGLTTDRLVATPKQKQSLAAKHCADVVDMESFWLATIAASHSVPFLTVRAVSDRLEDTMPESTRRVLSAEASRVRLLIDTSLHPRQWASLVRLARHARIAMQSLVPCLNRLTQIGKTGWGE